jgi:diadenosine tetraphosphate (Ap4A) HIT family hydrolase
MMARRRVPFDLDGLVRRSTSGRCFICEFLRGNPDYEHVAVYETSTSVAFLNKYPTLFGYVIVAPKEHREQVTGDFGEPEYLELQKLIFRVAEGMRRVLSPERIYILSLGSQAANSHVHWHIAPLPRGLPLAEQQFHALMHEQGVVEVAEWELVEYATQLHRAIVDGT